MAKTLGMLFGIVFLAVGILGFVPSVTSDVNGMPMLLGIFHVNTAQSRAYRVGGHLPLRGNVGRGSCAALVSDLWCHLRDRGRPRIHESGGPFARNDL